MNKFISIISHDTFRHGAGLNKSAGEIYYMLMQDPMRVKEIVECTGRGKSTVYRALKNMSSIIDSRTGEVIKMVHNQDGVWSANPDINLDQIALIKGSAGIGKRKAAQYRQEQREHRTFLRMNKKKKTSDNR